MNREFIGALLAGLAVFVFMMAIVLNLFGQADKNRQKVENMTTVCVEQGYSGWSSSYGCFGGTNEK